MISVLKARLIVLLGLVFPATLMGIPFSELTTCCSDVNLVQGVSDDEHVMICCHGYAGDAKIANIVSHKTDLSYHLIGFNFPDHGPEILVQSGEELSFGGFEELVPLFKLMRVCAIDKELPVLSLYGFSAGGGAIVNALAVLNSDDFSKELEEIEITSVEKTKILESVSQGIVVLDCPLKSIEEIVKVQGALSRIVAVQKRYKANGMRPIDRLESLKGLNLTVLLHFQSPDEILSNEDDDLYIERLKSANEGETLVVIGSEGRHRPCRGSLVEALRDLSFDLEEA